MTDIKWASENGPIQVVNAAGLRGVQKPGHDHPRNPHTAATEKIVADLAHALKLPVPPVTLFDRGPAITQPPRYVAISAWAYDDVLTWGQADPSVTEEQRAALAVWASAMLPFESWIAADDRHNPGNMLVGTAPDGTIVGAWIDYAFSLDLFWRGNLVEPCHVGKMYPPVAAQPDPAAMKEVAERISAMENATVEEIVNRVPAEYLPRASADNIVRNLLARRASVRALV